MDKDRSINGVTAVDGFLRAFTTTATSTNTTTSTAHVEEGSLTWYGGILVAILVLLSALFNANNIGTMSLDEGYLELLTKGPYESVKEEK